MPRGPPMRSLIMLGAQETALASTTDRSISITLTDLDVLDCPICYESLTIPSFSALVWGSSAKHKPQRVGKEHLLEDEDIVQIIKEALSVLKLQKGNQMPEDYPRSFREAAADFQHAQVYDSDKKIVKHMRPIPQELVESLDGELDFLGSYFFVIYFFLLSG